MDIYNCPIRIFQRVIETGKYEKITQEEFELINNQIVDEFGIPELQQLIYYKQRDITKLELKTIIENTEAYGTELEIAKIQLKHLTKQVKQPEDIRKLHSTNHRVLTKWSGRNSTELTVFDYYNDLKDFQSELDARENREEGYSFPELSSRRTSRVR